MSHPRAARFPTVGPTSRRLVLAVVVLVIGVLTLTPQPKPVALTFGHWCVVCGNAGGADFVANVIMFAPLGAALAFAGMAPVRIVLLCALYSTGIELTQLLLVPGRLATLGDVVSNTGGGLLGLAMYDAWSHWAAPTPRAARRYAALAAAAWVAVYGAAGWALRLDPGDGPARVAPSTQAFTPAFGWFAGHVLAATVDDARLTHAGTGPLILEGRVAPGMRASVTAVGFDRRTETVPMLYVHGPGDQRPRLLIAQSGPNALLGVRQAAGRWRLRQLRLLLPAVFPPSDSGPYTIRAAIERDSIVVAADVPGAASRSRTLRITPALGWALLSPIPRVDSAAAPLMTVVWLLGLTLPLGYWLRWALVGRPLLGPAVALLLVAATMGATSPMFGFAPAPTWEWVAALAGSLGGAAASAVAHATMRTRPSRSS